MQFSLIGDLSVNPTSIDRRTLILVATPEGVNRKMDHPAVTSTLATVGATIKPLFGSSEKSINSSGMCITGTT